MFYDRVAATPEAEAYRFPTATGWTSVTWAQTGGDREGHRRRSARAGHPPEERVAIASATRIEWLYADLAIMCAGAATTAVYPSTERRGRRASSCPTADRGSSSPRTTRRSPSCALQRDHLPDVSGWSPSTARPTASGC